MTANTTLTAFGLALILTGAPPVRAEDKPQDPYHLLPSPDSTQDTADEPFISRFSLPAAAQYLDAHSHLVENNCFACHSTYSYMAARSVIDPLAKGVMESRVMLERYVAETKTRMHERANRVLVAAELARHDALTTGHLQPVTRKALDEMWRFQNPDGGVTWLHVGEAPYAIDDYYGVATMALGAGLAPDDYARTEKAGAGIEKLRGWFRSHPAGSLLANAAIKGVFSDDERRQHTDAILARQLADGGWSTATLGPWTRPDKKPLDATRSDGLATGYMTLALSRGGVAITDERLKKAVEWLKSNQRQSGGWFTHSPFKRDKIASNGGTSFAVQALAACGEITTPRVSVEQFNAGLAAADKAVPAGVSAPTAMARTNSRD